MRDAHQTTRFVLQVQLWAASTYSDLISKKRVHLVMGRFPRIPRIANARSRSGPGKPRACFPADARSQRQTPSNNTRTYMQTQLYTQVPLHLFVLLCLTKPRLSVGETAILPTHTYIHHTLHPTDLTNLMNRSPNNIFATYTTRLTESGGASRRLHVINALTHFEPYHNGR